jgi:predicted DNA-binding protein
VKEKHPTSFRLSEEALRLLALLSDNLGVSQGAVVELTIREAAKKKGIS